MRFTFASLVFAVAAAGCATDDGGRTGSELQTSPDPTATYRVVLQLSSAGSGIDHAAESDVFALINRYDIDLSPDLHEWGLEGERNLCFGLTGLNAEAQTIFVGKLDEIAQARQLVFVYQNARCDTFGE